MPLINAIRKTPNIYGVYEYIENVRSRDMPTDVWDHDPDLTLVDGVDRKYWKFESPNVIPMTEAESLAVRLAMTPTNAEYMTTWQHSGRFYLYTDGRWVTDSDDNYGVSYYQFAESGGTGDNPILEWEHQGRMVEQGERLRRLTINCRANSNEVTDFEIRLVARYPTNPERFRTGLSGDANMTNDTLLSGLFMNPTDIINWDTAYTGTMNTFHRRTINVDYQFPSDGWLSLYVRPIGTLTANRYLLTSIRYDMIAVNDGTQI